MAEKTYVVTETDIKAASTAAANAFASVLKERGLQHQKHRHRDAGKKVPKNGAVASSDARGVSATTLRGRALEAAVSDALNAKGLESPAQKAREITERDRVIVIHARGRFTTDAWMEARGIICANLALTPQQVAGILAVQTRTATG